MQKIFRPYERRRRLTRATVLMGSTFLMLAVGAAHAEEPAGTEQEKSATRPSVFRLDTINVIADRTEKPIEDSTATVTVIDEVQIEDRNVHRMQDLISTEPGITVSNDPSRAGAGGYNIRGIEDNRVLMLIDGIKLPDLPGGVLLRDGGFTPYTRDEVDMDSLRQVEILRGPASAAYGSDAIGGVVGYATKSPEDVLAPGRDTFFSLKGAYDSKDESWSETGTTAARAGDFSILALYTRRDGQEVDNGYTGRNSQNWSGNNVLGKLVYDHEADRIALTGEFFQRAYDTRMFDSQTSTYTNVDGDDETKRRRISLEHKHDAPVGFADSLSWNAYYSGLDRDEKRIRNLAAGGYQDYRQNSTQDIFGGNVQAESKTDWFGVPNTLTYGLSLDYTRTERLREYAAYNAGGALTTTTTPDGAPTPSRFFPNTDTIQGGLFAQNAIGLGALTVTPGLRLDYYHLDPDPDAAYLSNPSAAQAKEIEKLALSPKLGLVYRLDSNYSVYGQYAHGFRAPPYDDANTGFSNNPIPGISYSFLPNPELKAETSDGIELGFRARYDGGSSLRVSSFYNHYNNFIYMKTIQSPSFGTEGLYQADNMPSAEIYGAEIAGEWRFVPGWGLNGSAAYAEGRNIDTDAPIDSVAPLTLQTGLTYDSTDDWGAAINAKHVFKHNKVSSDDYYRTKSYTTVGLNAYYTPFDWIEVRAGIENLFDERYINFADVEQYTPGSSTAVGSLDSFVAAGRSFNVSVTMKW